MQTNYFLKYVNFDYIYATNSAFLRFYCHGLPGVLKFAEFVSIPYQVCQALNIDTHYF